MKRPMKFKFVVDEGTKFVKVYDLTIEGVRECRNDNKDWLYTDEDYFVQIFKGNFSNIRLLQFTGLLDKNGKEIYEGDIWKDLKGNIEEVKISTNGVFPESVRSIYGEVIGNIWENPELLPDNQDEG